MVKGSKYHNENKSNKDINKVKYNTHCYLYFLFMFTFTVA